MIYRGHTYAVGHIRDLCSVYSYLIENKQYFTGSSYEVITLERQYVRASWGGEYPADIKAPLVSRLFPRVGFGTVWGCPRYFVSYGLYAAGVEELQSLSMFETQEEGEHHLERACAIVEAHLKVVAVLADRWIW